MKRAAFFIPFIILLISCTSQPDPNEPRSMGEAIEVDEGHEAHPQSNRVPHADVRSEKLDINETITSVMNLPKQIELLHDILNGDQNPERNELSLLYNSMGWLNVESLDRETLIIMEKLNNRLVQYDLPDGQITELAEEGRGPGDILFTREMQLFDQKMYIAMQGFRVSLFDCTTGLCEFENTIDTGVNNYSITRTNSGFTVLGLPPFGFDDSPGMDEEIRQFTLHQFTEEGEKTGMFSPVYSHQNPMIPERMSAEGFVRYHPESGRTILISQWLPYLYIYNSDAELEEKYRIPDFIQGYYNLIVDDQISYFRNDMPRSIIQSVTSVDDQFLVIQITNRTNLRGVDRTSRPPSAEEYDQHVTYYAFDMSADQLYKLGEDHYRDGAPRLFYVAGHGLLEAGEEKAYWIGL
ncbi:hypothetical protein DYD21_12030 [Rhodohalobacter sp. SW132]|uniref:YncE family protein n=1 Tax=Rhodohalobacter sp. SW132 TaxID=2293433 RepID=UPI000E27A81D|nr:hypothetical protein [Rhodohalobacter sp. SW132]REL33490.1 hypothetical protein DYD21_12030 [Rhodohalobacter sp. SW132]